MRKSAKQEEKKEEGTTSRHQREGRRQVNKGSKNRPSALGSSMQTAWDPLGLWWDGETAAGALKDGDWQVAF
jgi:hypothetical protein